MYKNNDIRVLEKHLEDVKKDLKKNPDDKFLQHQLEITKEIIKETKKAGVR